MRPDAALDLALRRALAAFAADQTPSLLGEAMAYALFPGGARLRPSLALAVADGAPGAASRALGGACALELLHGASLVHDDLPCFDDAATRRHKPSVHRAFGQALAVLAGDALLALSFRAVGDLAEVYDGRTQALVARAATSLMHGQAQELSPKVALEAYHQAKTGCLFEAAARVGALASGRNEAAWGQVGRRLGGAYQLADDLVDVLGNTGAGKDGARDAAHNRPNFALRHGARAARAELQSRLHGVRETVNALDAPRGVHAWLDAFADKLAPVLAAPRPLVAPATAQVATRRAVASCRTAHGASAALASQQGSSG